MTLAASRTIGREEDAIAGAVERADIVVARGLIRNLTDDRRLVFAEAGDLVDLPVVLVPLILLRRADDHREERLRATPMHARLAHRDRFVRLHPVVAEARGAREIFHDAVGIDDPEIAAARR